MRNLIALSLLTAAFTPDFARPQGLPQPRVVDLVVDKCVDVKAGERVRFAFRVHFDGDRNISEYRYSAYVSFVTGPASGGPLVYRQALNVQTFSVGRIADPDLFEYVGTVDRQSKNGEYRMDSFGVSASYQDPVLHSGMGASADLSPEAREQIKRYRICVSDGYEPPPPPKGIITFVGPPKV